MYKRTRLKDYIGKRVRIDYVSKANDANTLHGIINAVSRDYVIMIDFYKSEHIIRRSKILICEPLKKKMANIY
jgi:ribosome maturation factor RimP